MTERRNRTSNTLVDHQRDLSTAIAVDTLIDFFDEIGVESRHWEGESGASMANRNRVALMSTIEAYTPADPIPYPEKVEDIHQPEPVAETEEHRAVCNAIDACDEYNGPLDVAPEPSFLCPISHSAYRAPVCAPDGHIYEKTYIEATKKAALVRCVPWCSPLTRARWTEASLFPASTSTMLAMKLWVKVKAMEVAGATPLDSVVQCAALLQEAL
jgi:hypothetical protein